MGNIINLDEYRKKRNHRALTAEDALVLQRMGTISLPEELFECDMMDEIDEKDNHDV